MGLIHRLFGSHIAPESASIPVTLWSKPECHLCEQADLILVKLAREFPIAVEHRNIEDNPDAYARYWNRIPVVEIAGGQTFEGKITEYRLKNALRDVTRH